jgi:hypothetical protein
VKILLFLLAACSIVFNSHAATYYLSPAGNDANNGTTPATAWRTTSRANATTYQPGDQLLLEGGQNFAGGLWLTASGVTTAAQPIVISSFGMGRATISSGTAFGFYADNIGGIELRNLVFVGSGRQTNTNSGVIFYTEAVNSHLSYLRLNNLDVSGYRASGISIGSWKGTSGYSDVRITNCATHANGEAGLSSYAEALAAHHNWYVGSCTAYDNSGRTDVTYTHTGNGIVVSGIDGVTIERCEAYHNGWLNANPNGGPVGIWGWCCNNLVIQNSESHHNSSGTTKDGGGFDLDGGCTNSVLQYNYSHDNGGPGYLLAQYPGAPPMHDLTVRYNVSENDARRDNQGAIQLWSSGASGGIQRANVHNNTVLLSPTTNGSFPRAVYIMNGDISGSALRNNVLKTTSGLPLITCEITTGIRLEGNLYWTGAAPIVVQWNGTTYSSLAAWRSATGQERLANGRDTGIAADPQLMGNTANFSPLPSSPVVGSGLNLQAEFNTYPGPRDFVGNSTPQSTAAGNIGALETRPATPLPVELKEFTVAQQGSTALLRWATASEKNNAYFVVEQSTDGRTFAALGPVAGHGNTTTSRAYQFADAKLMSYAAGTVYYRLRQVDADGKYTYSAVQGLVVSKAVANGLAVLNSFPNPARATAHLTVTGAPGAFVEVLNVRGQLLSTAPVAADGTAVVPVAGLTVGLYILKSGGSTGRFSVEN